VRPALAVAALVLPMVCAAPVDYQPLKVGNTWRYREMTESGTSGLVLTVKGTKKVDGRTAYVMEIAPEEGEKTTSLLYWTDDGLMQAENGALAFDPPLIELKLPVKRGSEWTWFGTVSIRGAKYPAKAQCKCTSIGKLTVPAGQFDCVVIKKEVSIEVGETVFKVTTTDSYGKGVGWVKGVMDVGGKRTTTELLSYKLAD
jgi:hypothetical protein